MESSNTAPFNTRQLVSSWILTSRQQHGHVRTNNTFKLLLVLHRFKTQVMFMSEVKTAGPHFWIQHNQQQPQPSFIYFLFLTL